MMANYNSYFKTKHSCANDKLYNFCIHNLDIRLQCMFSGLDYLPWAAVDSITQRAVGRETFQITAIFTTSTLTLHGSFHKCYKYYTKIFANRAATVH